MKRRLLSMIGLTMCFGREHTQPVEMKVTYTEHGSLQ
ncbi:hypothetical protein SAMN05192543_101397 [Paraburkholderia megapolitana]|uniref:Uncharacterized protein n=1 Tax=Paraburkholderia megapolitana TaxID=420953 RepID=A0A1I3DM36_9BURK|nr:hypothetical protein SAMN05192543_101397 [Paraburkholderia megapolitana]